MFLSCLLLAILTVSSVCAADNQTDIDEGILQENPSDCIGLNENTDGEISSSSQTEVLGNTCYSSLKNLKEDIDNTYTKATLALDRDYAYSEADQFSVLTIDKSLTIDGNGHSITGGHIYVSSGNVVFRNISFVSCYSKYNEGMDSGGAISGNNIKVIDCKFTNCSSQGEGGAIYGENIIVTNCIFSGCKAKNGAAVAGNYGKFTNCTFTANKANENGGAIYGEYCTVIGSNLNENIAGGSGGAIYGINANVQNSSFYGNRALAVPTTEVDPPGGGTIFSKASLTVNCYFYGNSAVVGGAIYNGAAINCTFRRNTGSWAGAIFHGDAIDSYFYDNHADYVGGACQQTYCINCTFRGNVADGLYDFALKGGGIILCKFDGDTHDARLIKDIKFYPNSQYSVSQGDFVYIHETGVEITGLRERDESMDGFFMTIVEAYQDGVLKATNYFEFGRPFWKVALPAGDYKCVLRVGDYKSDFISVHVDPTIKILASDITTTYGGEGMEVTITDFLGNPLKHKSCAVQVDNNPSFWVSTDENGKFTIGPEDLEPFGNLIGSHDITINLYSFDDGSVSLSKTVKMVINKADVKLKVNLEKDSYYTYENITFNIDAIHPKAKGTLSFSINGLTYNFTDVEIKNLIFPFQDFLKAHMTTL